MAGHHVDAITLIGGAQPDRVVDRGHRCVGIATIARAELMPVSELTKKMAPVVRALLTTANMPPDLLADEELGASHSWVPFQIDQCEVQPRGRQVTAPLPEDQAIAVFGMSVA
jgi:hypothetical protein